MASNLQVESYSSAKTISMVVVGLLIMQIVCYGFYLLLSTVQIASPDMVFEADDGTSFSIPLLLIGLLSIAEWILRLATIVVFLIWLHRTYSNLPRLNAHNLEFTPGWAVGWWFIPFANLVKPYQAVSEAWRESDPEYNEDFGYMTSTVGNHWIFPVWWGSFILGNAISRIGDKVIDMESGLDSYPYLLIATSIFTGVAAVSLIWIVRDTTRRMDLRFERLRNSTRSFEPPPPPVFGQQV